MGKASRRFNRGKNRKQTVQETKAQNAEKQTYEAQMKALMDNEQYADALNVLAEMIQEKIYDAEDMYRGAYCYFMTGDYARAAQWLTNTLSFAPTHVAARLLLARICILEDRTDDGMAIYDFVLEHYESSLDEEQREDMEDILEYYVEEDKAHVREAYPHVAAFMHIGAAEAPAAKAPAASVNIQAQAPAGAAVHVDVARGDEHTAVQLPQAGVPAAAESEAAEASIEQEAETQLARVRAMAKDVSLAERVRILNTFAGGYFVADELAAAKSFLAEALALDAKNDTTLRNLAMLAKAQGDKEKALQFASAMQTTDFVLLQALKD